jgi:hypothetical protein
MAGWNNPDWRTSSILYPYLLGVDSDQYFWHDESTSILWIPTWRRSVYTLGNPQPGSNPVGGNFTTPLGSNPTGGNFHNPYQNIPAGMMPNPPFMNHPGGGPYNSGQGHGAYQNPGWNAVPQHTIFRGSLGPDVATPSPFSGHA